MGVYIGKVGGICGVGFVGKNRKENVKSWVWGRRFELFVER